MNSVVGRVGVLHLLLKVHPERAFPREQGARKPLLVYKVGLRGRTSPGDLTLPMKTVQNRPNQTTLVREVRLGGSGRARRGLGG